MKIRKIFLILALIFMMPFSLFACTSSETPQTPAETTPTTPTTPAPAPTPAPKAGVLEVLGSVADKLVETNNMLASTGSGVDDASDDSNSLGANLTGFSKATIGDDYLFIQERSSQIIYGIDYLANNATIANGYANGFELNKTYSGICEIDGFSGAIKINLSETENGIKVNFDFDTEQDGFAITYIFNGFISYDYETNKLKRLQMNQFIAPNASEIWAVDIDFENNNFTGFQAYNYEWDFTPEIGEEVLESYNSGLTTFEDMMSLDWTHIVFCSGNLATNINDMNMLGYEYNRSDSSNSVNSIMLDTVFRGVYNKVKTLPFRGPSEKLDGTNAILVNYTQDAIDYGWSRARYYTTTDNTGKEHFLFTYIDYEEMLGYLGTVKTQLNTNEYSQVVKDTINSAYGYVNNQGKERYTNSLGQFDGITTSIIAEIYFVNGQTSDSGYYVRNTIKNSNGTVLISFLIKDSELKNVEVIELTNGYMVETITELLQPSVPQAGKEWLNTALSYYQGKNENEIIDQSYVVSMVWSSYFVIHKTNETSDYYGILIDFTVESEADVRIIFHYANNSITMY